MYFSFISKYFYDSVISSPQLFLMVTGLTVCIPKSTVTRMTPRREKTAEMATIIILQINIPSVGSFGSSTTSSLVIFSFEIELIFENDDLPILPLLE